MTMSQETTTSPEMLDILRKVHDLGPTADGESVYDIEIADITGDKNALTDRKGKVTMIVNVTGECGNSMQYPILQVLQYDYANTGFSIVCVPTNDYCEFGYGEFKDSRSTAEECERFAHSHYRVRLPFTELVTSRYSRDDDDDTFEPHPLYHRLGAGTAPILGNFEKFIVSKDGKRVARFTNGSLLPANFEMGKDNYSPEEALERIRAVIELFLSEPDPED